MGSLDAPCNANISGLINPLIEDDKTLRWKAFQAGSSFITGHETTYIVVNGWKVNLLRNHFAALNFIQQKFLWSELQHAEKVLQVCKSYFVLVLTNKKWIRKLWVVSSGMGAFCKFTHQKWTLDCDSSYNRWEICQQWRLQFNEEQNRIFFLEEYISCSGELPI